MRFAGLGFERVFEARCIGTLWFFGTTHRQPKG
ncbi:hypothetical protein [Mycobacterium phage Fezzik]|nr:hypothetical protein [Mycobacterium phage Fezzik]